MKNKKKIKKRDVKQGGILDPKTRPDPSSCGILCILAAIRNPKGVGRGETGDRG